MNMKAMHEEGAPVGDTKVLAYIFLWLMEEPMSQ
jgi:hypothetical protein